MIHKSDSREENLEVRLSEEDPLDTLAQHKRT
jgi:hypothetical protein